MTVATISEALNRISMTCPSSPLAVFRTKRPECVDAMFANTVLTQMQIRNGHIDYLGTFHRENLPEAREKLLEYADSAQDAA